MNKKYVWVVAPLLRWQSWTLWGLMESPVARAVWFIYLGPLRCVRRTMPHEREQKPL